MHRCHHIEEPASSGVNTSHKNVVAIFYNQQMNKDNKDYLKIIVQPNQHYQCICYVYYSLSFMLNSPKIISLALSCIIAIGTTSY